MSDLPLLTIVAANIILALGACLQCTIGFGIALLSAPLLNMMDPRFIPGPMIMNSTVLTVILLIRERRSLRLREFYWSIAGNIPGTVLAGITLAVVPVRFFDVLFGVLIVLAVVISALGYRPPFTGATCSVAGAAAGFMGTCTAVGGPPMALLYQDAEPSHIRANLSAYFLFASFAGLIAIYFSGRLSLVHGRMFIMCVPGVLTGFFISRFVVGRISPQWIRPLILGVATTAGILAIAKPLLAGS